MRTQATKARYDVIIVGGAVTGSSTAYFLAANPDFTGSVLVIERDWSYAKSATALSSSSIRHQFSNAINVQISQFGTEFIRKAGDVLEVEGNRPNLHLVENGYLFVAPPGRGVDVLRRNHETQRAMGADVTLLQPDALAERFPWLNVSDLALGSIGESGEGWFDNVGLLNAFRAKARSLGIEYIEAEVVSLACDSGRVHSVTLASGQTVSCGILVNASGTRGRKVAAMAGLDIPVEPRRRSLFVFACATRLPGPVPMVIDHTGLFFRPEGQFFLAGTTPDPDPEVAFDDFEIMHHEFEDAVWPALYDRVPTFESIKVVNSWAGHYDFCTLDHNVILGPHPDRANFLFANGFSGHGLQQSPAIGRALSELITYGGYRTLDLSPLGYARVIANEPFTEDSVI